MAKNMKDDNSNSKETIEETTSIADSVDISQEPSYDGRHHLPQYVNPEVAVHEEKAVVRSFLFMIIVLLFALTAMASIVSRYVRSTEIKDFQDQFNNSAYDVLQLSKRNAANTLASIEAFSEEISSYADSTGKTWPYVIVPDFTARAEKLAEIASARRVVLCPLVHSENRDSFEKFAGKEAMSMIKESMIYEGMNTTKALNMTFRTEIEQADVTGMTMQMQRDESDGPYLTGFQLGPFTERHFGWIYLFNYMSDQRLAEAYYASEVTNKPTIVFYLFRGELYSNIMMPVYNRLAKNKTDLDIVGAIIVKLEWLPYFQNLLPRNVNGIDAVLESDCNGDSVTYQIDGESASFKGIGDGHNPKYEHMVYEGTFADVFEDTGLDVNEINLPPGMCVPKLRLRIYPSEIMENSYLTNNSTIYALVVVAIFVFTSFVFIVYDCSVRRRQNKVMDRVIKQDKIVSNLFPVHLKDRLYGLEISGEIDSKGNTIETLSSDPNDGAPLADLFLEATVIFADISGFTAWSSTREPSQVFKLLETIYGAFDKIAQARGVFKIETVGDCYVAVTGLPEERKDHALAMAKFARDCMEAMSKLTRKLEMTLGPDTCDLAMRMGLHSGQVTAGVLRGERSRFQLFGDTVNTTARMESAGRRNKIHISEVTANLLLKERTSKKWVTLRSGTVSLKGKGEMQTFWLETKAETSRREKKSAFTFKGMEMDAINEITDHDIENSSVTLESETESEEDMKNADWGRLEEMSKIDRLVEWNVEVLAQLLQQIIAARIGPGTKTSLAKRKKQAVVYEQELETGSTVLEEFKEIIQLPKIQPKDLEKRRDPKSVEVPPAALAQLRDFISKIGGMYRNNAFHNFEHASHVTSSVRKLLSRIVRYDNDPVLGGKGSSSVSSSQSDFVDLTCHSYGITSDPLTQFSVVFSAIIHDADHPGVPNTQLVKEKVPLASRYKQKSVAEQNSVDLAWNLLMASQYEDLRACIYCNANEMKRFRQLIVNTVMATDICDKELGMLRKMRWARAFSDTPVDSSYDNNINRKATIVIEHLIQASDVSHTMQHWHVYRKWNERFFMECYGAYKAGRADSDPSVGWYKGEIGFFDFYVIPLAKKLESCGVFGVSSHEYLNYAMTNREEWVKKGESIVETYIENYKLGNTSSPTI